MATVKIGEAGTIEVNVDALKAMAQVSDYIWHYGLKQMLNDVHAGETAKKTPDEKTRVANKRALVEKKLASLMAGEVAQERVGGGLSPVEREMRNMAEADLKRKLAGIGKKVSDYEKSVWQSVIGKQVEKFADKYRAAAEAKLAIKPEVDDTDDILALLDESDDEADVEETETETE